MMEPRSTSAFRRPDIMPSALSNLIRSDLCRLACDDTKHSAAFPTPLRTAWHQTTLRGTAAAEQSRIPDTDCYNQANRRKRSQP